MSAVKILAATGLTATVLAGCGTSAKPLAGTPAGKGQPASRGKVDDPRTTHLKCLKSEHLRVVKVGQTGLQVDALPGGPTIDFRPTPGAAQESQLTGGVQSAEVIGSALLYPNQASDPELKKIEDCLALGVLG